MALPVMVPCALSFMVIATIYLAISQQLHSRKSAAHAH
jgi:hypothetical protein